MRKSLLALLFLLPLTAQAASQLAPMPRLKASPIAAKQEPKKDVKPQPKPIPVPPKPAPLAAEPELIGATTFDYLAEFKVRNVPTGTAVIWDVFPDDAKTVTRIIKVEKAILVAGPPREYSIKVRLVKGEDVSEFKKTFRITGGIPYVPPKPVDPVVPVDPKIDPIVPVDPKVLPPIPEPGFRVMVLYQDALKHRYSSAQKDLIFGDEFRDYVRSKAIVGPDGKTPEVRIWDVDIQGVQNESTIWQKAFARPRLVDVNGKATDAIGAGYLWLIVSNGTTGWEGPVGPNDIYADIFARVKKVGG